MAEEKCSKINFIYNMIKNKVFYEFYRIHIKFRINKEIYNLNTLKTLNNPVKMIKLII